MSNALSEPVVCPSCRARISPGSPAVVRRQCGAAGRWLRPLLGAVLVPVLLALVALLPAVASSLHRAQDGRRAIQAPAGAPKTPLASTPGKPKAAHAAAVPEVKTGDDAAAFRLLRKTEAITKHPEKATQAQLLQAAHDLTLATELAPDFELATWFHADLGTVFYARAKAKRGPERTYLLEKSRVRFYLAMLTHDISLNGGTDASDVTDFVAAGDATASFILYHVGLLEYELGRPSNAVTPLDLLLAAAADHELERPEYVRKARTLLAEVKRSEAKHGR